MGLNDSAIPESKRFFKISELAGKRWPTVTEEEIYNWHDLGHETPIEIEGFQALVDTTEPNMWNDTPHFGQINIFAYWIHFETFYSMVGITAAELLLKTVGDERADFLKKYARTLLESLNAECIPNSFFMINIDSARNLAYRKNGVISCLEFYDEKGMLRISAMPSGKPARFSPESLEIRKEDLLIKASSVKYIERIIPELMSNDRHSKGEIQFQKAANKRAEKTDLKIIGALLTIIKDHTDLQSQAQIIDRIVNDERFKRLPGLSERAMQGRFSSANTVLKDVGD
nr:hypothetical protein [uncultured Desulfobulbus sp.]